MTEQNYAMIEKEVNTMDEIEMLVARLYVLGVAFDMLQAAWEGLTLDADVVEQRALRLRDMALAGV